MVPQLTMSMRDCSWVRRTLGLSVESKNDQPGKLREMSNSIRLPPSPQRWGSTSSIPECSTDTRVRGQPLAVDATTTRCLIQLFIYFSALHNSRESERPFYTPFVVDDGENLPHPSTTSLRYCRPLNMSVIRLFNRISKWGGLLFSSLLQVKGG